MTEHHDQERLGNDRPPLDGVGELLRLSGAQAPIAEMRAVRVRGRVHDAWRESIQRRARARQLRWGGLAAAAALAAMLGWLAWGPGGRHHGGEEARVATAASVAGTVRLLPTPRQPAVRVLETGSALEAGAMLDTGAGRAALVLASGTTIRLDAGTRLRLASAEVLELERGAVYAVAEDAALEIQTPLGTARDIGTRFEVRIDDETLRVRVRDGWVDIENAGRRHRAEAGTEVRLTAGRVERSPLPAHGATWHWTVAIAPPFALDGATLAQFLVWLENESGWHVAWANSDLQQEATGIDLFGPPIEHMAPAQALAAVMAITGLEHRRDGNVVTVSRAVGEKGAVVSPQ